MESSRQERGQGPDDPIRRSEEAAGTPTDQDKADSLGRDLLEIHERSYGRAAERVRTHLLGDTLIVLIEGIELLPNEVFLIENGNKDAVARLRTDYQQAIAPTFRAAVERAMNRQVLSFSSQTQLDEPMFLLEVFRLAPES